MLYLASNSDKGLSIFLGLCKENVEQIKLDNPLMARLDHCGYHGLFFLFGTEDAEDSPKMKEARTILSRNSIRFDAFGISTAKLDDIQAGRCVLMVKPGDRLPGVEKIVVLFCEDQKKLATMLRKEGMLKADMTVIPRDPEDN